MKLFPANSEVSKYKVAEHLLESGVTMMHILRDRPGVVIPSFLNTRIVRLNFSYRYGISDFCVDKRGIRASLSFQGQPQFCDIPWEAICGISSAVTDEMFFWIDIFSRDELLKMMPPEIVAGLDDMEKGSIFEEMPELKQFAVDEVKDSESDEEDEAEEDEEDDDAPEGGYTPLRFV